MPSMPFGNNDKAQQSEGAFTDLFSSVATGPYESLIDRMDDHSLRLSVGQCLKIMYLHSRGGVSLELPMFLLKHQIDTKSFERLAENMQKSLQKSPASGVFGGGKSS